MGATVIVNTVYLVGGLNDKNLTGSLQPVQHNVLGDRWSSFDAAPAPVGARPAVVALDTRLYILGGQVGKTFSAAHMTYQAIYTINLPVVQ
jgi:hypothetical protein